MPTQSVCLRINVSQITKEDTVTAQQNFSCMWKPSVCLPFYYAVPFPHQTKTVWEWVYYRWLRIFEHSLELFVYITSRKQRLSSIGYFCGKRKRKRRGHNHSNKQIMQTDTHSNAKQKWNKTIRKNSDCYIAGNFRGRKLSWISWLCGYLRRFSLWNLGVWHPLVWQKQAICERFLSENRIFHQFVKVFSIKSFPLYGINHVNVSMLQNGYGCGGGGGATYLQTPAHPQGHCCSFPRISLTIDRLHPSCTYKYYYWTDC